MNWLIAFVAMFCTDFAWSAYVASVKSGGAISAGLWAVVLYALGAVAVIGYTRNRWLLLPGALGAYAGTVIGVLYV